MSCGIAVAWVSFDKKDNQTGRFLTCTERGLPQPPSIRGVSLFAKVIAHSCPRVLMHRRRAASMIGGRKMNLKQLVGSIVLYFASRRFATEEEKTLAKTFGAAWDEYRQKVKLPCL